MIQVDVVFNDFHRIARDLQPAADAWAGEVAAQVRQGAEDNTVRVESGDMKDGWELVALGDGVWMVYNTQFYTIFHEFGTIFIPASPMLVPAVEALRNNLPSFWERVL